MKAVAGWNEHYYGHGRGREHGKGRGCDKSGEVNTGSENATCGKVRVGRRTSDTGGSQD